MAGQRRLIAIAAVMAVGRRVLRPGRCPTPPAPNSAGRGPRARLCYFKNSGSVRLPIFDIHEQR